MKCKGELDLQEPIGVSYRRVKEEANFAFDIIDLTEILEDMILVNEEARIGYNDVVELEDF